MRPYGAEEIELGFNKAGTITFTTPGIYGIRCTPHTGAGMVTAIVVGEPVNLVAATEAAGRLPPKARQRLLAAFETLRSAQRRVGAGCVSTCSARGCR